MKYLLAHDLGTSGNKATLFTMEGELVKSSVNAYATQYKNKNWAEQNPEDFWRAVCITTKDILDGINKKNVAVVSFSGQMMGALCVDQNGTPLRDHIIWADQRAVVENEMLIKTIGENRFYHITGQPLSPTYGLQKLLWIKANEPDIYRNTYKVINAKDYIVFKLTNQFVTEYSDAAGMGLLNINKCEWSDELIEEIGINRGKLPDVYPSIHIAGLVTSEAADETGLAVDTPVVCGGGDGVCASVGAGSVSSGTAYCILGSSSWISIATEKPIFDEQIRTFNWPHIVPNLYVPCGSMQAAGVSYSWLKTQICKMETKEAEEQSLNPYDIITREIEKSPVGAKGLLFLPYLLGERSPRWNPNARGAFIGLSMEHKREDVIRSVLEGITLNLNIILNIFQKHCALDELIVIGGGAKSQTWRKILADVFNINILMPNVLEEATSMGAAIAGGVGVGLFKGFDVIKNFSRINYIDMPEAANHAIYKQLMPIFDNCYYSLVDVYDQLAGI